MNVEQVMVSIEVTKSLSYEIELIYSVKTSEISLNYI